MNTPRQYRTRAEYDLPPVDGGPTRRYVICSTPRSGSTLLGRLLEASGRMGVPYEYLNMQVHAKPMAERLGARLDRPALYLQAVERVRTTPNGVFGLKAHFHQIGPLLGRPAIAQMMAGAALVWIRRRDLLGQSISYYRAARTRVWSVTQGEQAPATVAYSYEGLRKTMRALLMENAGWEAWFASHGRPYHPVWYEDLVDDPDAVCRSVCRLVLEDDIEHRFALSQADIVKMRDDITEEWRRRFIATSRAGVRTPAPPTAASRG